MDAALSLEDERYRQREKPDGFTSHTRAANLRLSGAILNGRDYRGSLRAFFRCGITVTLCSPEQHIVPSMRA